MGWRSRPALQAVTRGLLGGAVIGVLQGLDDASLERGVISGLLFGVVLTLLRYAGLRVNLHLDGLSSREKQAVMEAVRRGLPVTDPSLAPAAIRHAQRAQGVAGGQRLGPFLAWILLAISVVTLGVSMATGDAPGVAASAFSSVVWVAILVLGPKLEGRFRERARAAEVANRLLAEPPPGVVGPGRSRSSM